MKVKGAGWLGPDDDAVVRGQLRGRLRLAVRRKPIGETDFWSRCHLGLLSAPPRRASVRRPPTHPRAARHAELAHLKATRLEAFSDGVIAIVITIMVLELHVPLDDRGDVGLLALVPVLLSYVLSFVTVEIYWINLRRKCHRLQMRQSTPLSEALECGDGGQMPGERARLALLPVVDGLRGCTEQKPTLPSRKPKSPTLCHQTLGAEPTRGRRSFLVRRRHGPLRDLAHSAQVLLCHLGPSLQRCDLGTASTKCLLEANGLRTHFLARDARQLDF